VVETDKVVEERLVKEFIFPDTVGIKASFVGAMLRNIEYAFGDMVYLITDLDQEQRMVTAIYLRPGGSVSYGLSIGAGESTHYAIEISRERDIIKLTTN